MDEDVTQDDSSMAKAYRDLCEFARMHSERYYNWFESDRILARDFDPDYEDCKWKL